MANMLSMGWIFGSKVRTAHLKAFLLWCTPPDTPSPPCNHLQSAVNVQRTVQISYLIPIRDPLTSVCPSSSASSTLSGRVSVDRLYAARRLEVSNDSRSSGILPCSACRGPPARGPLKYSARGDMCESSFVAQSTTRGAWWRTR